MKTYYLLNILKMDIYHLYLFSNLQVIEITNFLGNNLITFHSYNI